jgi:hypothetical protein
MDFTLANGKQVLFFDDIKELPITRLSDFQIQLIQDAGMGSSIFDIDERLHKHDAFVAGGKLTEAQQERVNLSFGLHFLFNKISTKTLSLAYLVKSIGGVPAAADTEKQVLAIAQELEAGGITLNQVEELIDELKKKSTAK